MPKYNPKYKVLSAHWYIIPLTIENIPEIYFKKKTLGGDILIF